MRRSQKVTENTVNFRNSKKEQVSLVVGNVPSSTLQHPARGIQVNPQQEADERFLPVVRDLLIQHDTQEFIDAEDGLVDGLDEAVFALQVGYADTWCGRLLMSEIAELYAK